MTLVKEFNMLAMWQQRWATRKSRSTSSEAKGEVKLKKGFKQRRIYYPKELQEFLNLTTSMCTECGKPCSAEHLTGVHKIYVPANEIVLEKCRLVSETGVLMKWSRKEILNTIAKYIKPFIHCIKLHISKNHS